jgi:hypothetical protein
MNLDDQLDELERILSDGSFLRLAKSFEESLKQAHELSRSERDILWTRYQSLWQKRKDLQAQRRQG